MKATDTVLKKLDSAGIAASTLCAIHCVVMPLLLGGLTAAGVGWLHDERLEWAILAGSLAIGLFGLLPAYRRVHGHKGCLWLFCLGILCMISGRLATLRSLPDMPFIACGAALIVSAHVSNRYLCARCGQCNHSHDG
ncbi:MAG TPA: MerC domain-containing protein [Bryobacteraceae bacterium]|jgi:hypothetical protein